MPRGFHRLCSICVRASVLLRGCRCYRAFVLFLFSFWGEPGCEAWLERSGVRGSTGICGVANPWMNLLPATMVSPVALSRPDTRPNDRPLI